MTECECQSERPELRPALVPLRARAIETPDQKRTVTDPRKRRSMG
ncbi:hypothetical protein DB32_000445 [Sandaracinus amylolyticus]|uniref:Uncharacterized protein n=1 Tax=Sandaracinus amylolyticus TaxID=927083 RepID=A0A0F6VZB5_9BACT|nr:hypothetical protein DB32_000445 [Sandaracinus amylolyticus]